MYKKPYKPIGYYYEEDQYQTKQCEICGKFLSKKSPICFSCPMDEFRPKEENDDTDNTTIERL
jgi:hypothetical protein